MYVEEVHRSPFYFLLICNVLIKIHNLLKCDNNAGHFVKKLLICKHNKANDNLIHGN